MGIAESALCSKLDFNNIWCDLIIFLNIKGRCDTEKCFRCAHFSKSEESVG